MAYHVVSIGPSGYERVERIVLDRGVALDVLDELRAARLKAGRVEWLGVWQYPDGEGWIEREDQER